MTQKRFNFITKEVYLGYTGAFEEVFEAYYERLKTDAFCELKNKTLAEDMTSNALGNVFRTMRLTQDFYTEYPNAYMYTALHNAINDMYEEQNDNESLDEMENIADPKSDPEVACTKMDIYTAIDKLKNPENRKITRMFYFMKMKQWEIAKELGMPENTIKTRVRAIKAELEKYLK